MKRLLCRLRLHYWLSTSEPLWFTCRWCGRTQKIWDTKSGP